MLADALRSFGLPFDLDIGDLCRFLYERRVAFSLSSRVVTNFSDKIPIAVPIEVPTARLRSISTSGVDNRAGPYGRALDPWSKSVRTIPFQGHGGPCAMHKCHANRHSVQSLRQGKNLAGLRSWA